MNRNHGFRVMTKLEETGMLINRLRAVASVSENGFEVEYLKKKVAQPVLAQNNV